MRRERKEIRTELAKWKKDVKRRGSSHFKARENHLLIFQDGPLFKVSSLIVVIFTFAVFCFGFVCDSQGSSNFELALVEDVVLQVKDAVNPKQPIYQPTSKTEKVLGVETYQGEQVAPNVFSNLSFLIAIGSGAILFLLWHRRNRKRNNNLAELSNTSFLAKQSHKGVYTYFIAALAILIILKLIKASFIQDTIELFITFLPLIIIVVVSLVSYYRYLKEPIKGTEIRKKTLIEILYLLLITLIFYILFSPSSFLPMLTALQKFLRSFLAVENIFLLLSYFLILFLTFSLIWFFIRLYQKSKGSYVGSIRALARKELYCSFVLFAFVFLMTFFSFPKAYSPFTEVLGDSLYTASQGNIRLFKANSLSYEEKSIGDLFQGVKNAFSQTGSNIGESIKQVNTKFVEDLKDTKDNLNNSIAQASKDISETLSQDISKKLNLNGGTLDGSLTIRGGITVEDSSYFGDLYPENDDLYDLGLPSRQWKNVYVRRIHGSKGVTIGNSSSNHSLGSSDDFLVSGDFETKGTAYFDGKVDMDSNSIVNLADPEEEQDAATKIYVDNMIGSGAFFGRAGSTISVSNSGDTLNMDGGIIRNIGSSDTYFSMGGGLTLANVLHITSGGADIAGDTTIAGTLTITGGNLVLGGNMITTTNNTLVSNLNADLLDGQHATYFMPLSYLDTDDLLAAESDSKVASQKAVKTYIDNSIATENLWDRSGSSLHVHNSGDKIVISQLEAANANGLKLYDDAENGIFIKDGGNVGIGTTSPLGLLDVNGVIYSKGTAVLGSNGSTVTTIYSGSLYFGFQNYSGNNTLLKLFNGGGLSLGSTYSATDPGSGNMIIQGSVGIGTTSPGSTLDVQAAGVSQQIKSTTGTNSAYTNYANTGGTFRIGQDKSTGGGLLTNSAAYAGVIAHIGNYPLQFGTNNIIRMTVSNDGNVGIGTTAPNSTLSVVGNLSIGNVAAGTSGTRVLVLSNGTVPSTSPANSIQLYSEDVSDSSELKVRDEAGNITTLSPHNFSLIPEGRSEDLAWSYYSQRGNKAVNVDMAKAVRLIEQLSGEQLIYLKNLKSGSYDESLPDVETPLAIKELEEQSQNIATLQLQTTDNITTLEGLKTLVDRNGKTLEEEISGLDENISDISDRMETLEEQIAKIRLQNSEEGIGLIETRLGNLEIALNVAGSSINVLGSLSVAGDVDLLSGKLTAEDIEALGTVKGKNIEAEESVKGKTIKGDNLELGEETRGKAEIEAGDKEAEIETKAVSNNSQIYITPLGKLGGGNLYVDMDDIKEGKSFKVKLDGEELDSDIEFNWLIIK